MKWCPPHSVECPGCGAVDGPVECPEPHWTKEPPTEPGWYKAVYFDDDFEREPEVLFLYVTHQLLVYDLISTGYLLVSDVRFTHWWSQPEELPPLPRDGRDG
jgi:hypothetical protein